MLINCGIATANRASSASPRLSGGLYPCGVMYICMYIQYVILKKISLSILVHTLAPRIPGARRGCRHISTPHRWHSYCHDIGCITYPFPSWRPGSSCPFLPHSHTQRIWWSILAMAYRSYVTPLAATAIHGPSPRHPQAPRRRQYSMPRLRLLCSYSIAI